MLDWLWKASAMTVASCEIRMDSGGSRTGNKNLGADETPP